MPNYNSIFSDAIYALSGKVHIKGVPLIIDDGDMPNIPYLLCELDCQRGKSQACHIYPTSDGKELIVAGELALDALNEDIYRSAEAIAKNYELEITKDPIGENNVFSDSVPFESYKWKLYDSVLKVARAEKKLSETRRM